jgi:hypothetical protein
MNQSQVMWHLDSPKTMGTSRTALSVGSTDITVPSGARRVVVTVPAGTTNTIRIRAGISGTASITSDITTLVAPTSAYVDTILLGDDTGINSVDLRFTDSITWIRVYSATAFSVHCNFFSSTAADPLKVLG